MRFWTREIAGWLSLLLGLFGFYVCFVLLMSRQILEAGPMTFIAIFLFRGGIQLLKVATAARICQQAQERLAESARESPTTTPTSTSRATQRRRPAVRS